MVTLTRSPNGPDSTYLGILPQFGQNPCSGYCDIIVFMFFAVLVTALTLNLGNGNQSFVCKTPSYCILPFSEI